MITAKIPGVNTPCRNRQKSSCPKLVDVAASSVGTASRNAAGTMTRLRPKRSATTPAKGAAIATASVEADTTRLIAAAETRNSRASMGNSGCGANSVRKAQNPANTTAAVRVVEWAVAGSIPSIMPGGAIHQRLTGQTGRPVLPLHPAPRPDGPDLLLRNVQELQKLLVLVGGVGFELGVQPAHILFSEAGSA